jgi:hypothetical protein
MARKPKEMDWGTVTPEGDLVLGGVTITPESVMALADELEAEYEEFAKTDIFKQMMDNVVIIFTA